jgi:hypothetical protein
MAEIQSESVANFIPESVADFARNTQAISPTTLDRRSPRSRSSGSVGPSSAREICLNAPDESGYPSGRRRGFWYEKPERGAILHSLAGLLAFGLAEQSGSGNERHVRVSELGCRALEDSCLDIRGRVWAEAASKPQLIADYAVRWRGSRPEDHVCIAQLVREHGLSEQMAARFLRVFDEANFFISRYMPEITSDDRPEPPPVVDNRQPASATGISPPERDQFNVVQRGNRLEITANVDLAGLRALGAILDQYQKILQLVSPQADREQAGET